MLDVLHGAKLALEARQRVGSHVPQRLQRDAGAALLVERLVDDAHPAFAQASPQLESFGRGSAFHRAGQPMVAPCAGARQRRAARSSLVGSVTDRGSFFVCAPP
jgi:hypothetical protein